MVVYLTCDKYQVIATGDYRDDAPARCIELEQARNDGYAVIAMNDGRIIADADGWNLPDYGPADPMLAAMELRFDE